MPLLYGVNLISSSFVVISPLKKSPSAAFSRVPQPCVYLAISTLTENNNKSNPTPPAAVISVPG